MSSAALRGCGDDMYTDAALRGYGDDMYTDAALRGYGDDMYTDAALRGYGKRPHLVKGSPEAKAYMARLRAMRTGKRGGGKKRGGIALSTVGAILGLAPTVISGARALYDAIKGKKGGRDLVSTKYEREQWIDNHSSVVNGKRVWEDIDNGAGRTVSARYYAPSKTIPSSTERARIEAQRVKHATSKLGRRALAAAMKQKGDLLYLAAHYPDLRRKIKEITAGIEETYNDDGIVTPSVSQPSAPTQPSTSTQTSRRRRTATPTRSYSTRSQGSVAPPPNLSFRRTKRK